MLIVEIARSAEKEIKKAPQAIRDSFDAWKNLIEHHDPPGVQIVNGYWDHALRGEWKGARASSLSEQWRVIYVVKGGTVKILVLKVTPHDYRRK
jgi:addiction module RelE/StbE family toxin